MNKSNSKFVMGLTLVATLGGLLFGYDTAVISGAVSSLQSFFIDSLQENNDKALEVIWQYRVTVITVILVLCAAISAIIIKLFAKKRGAIISVILFIMALNLCKNFTALKTENCSYCKVVTK